MNQSMKFVIWFPAPHRFCFIQSESYLIGIPLKCVMHLPSFLLTRVQPSTKHKRCHRLPSCRRFTPFLLTSMSPLAAFRMRYGRNGSRISSAISSGISIFHSPISLCRDFLMPARLCLLSETSTTEILCEPFPCQFIRIIRQHLPDGLLMSIYST